MEFDRKTVTVIAVSAVIAISVIVFFVTILGSPGTQSGGSEEPNSICLFAPFTVQNSGTVNTIVISLSNDQVSGGSSGTLQLGLYDLSGTLITSGSASITVPYFGGGINYSISTTTQPQLIQGSQYYLAAHFSNTVDYDENGNSGISYTYETICSGLPSSFSTSSSTGSIAMIEEWAAGPGLTTTTTTSTTMSSSSSTTTIPLSVSVSASPSSGYAPLSTTFASIVSGGTAPYSYSWTFGDTGTSTAASPSHTYQSAGTYLAQLTVTDSSGATASASYSVVANPLTTSTTSYYTTTQTTVTTSTGITTVTSGSSTFTSTYTTEYITTQCLILNAVNGCHLPNTPPGLPFAWASSNISIGATAVPEPIVVASGLSVANIQSSNTISNIAFDSSAVQIELASSGPVSLSLQVPQKPSSVWADSTEISTWSYANGVLTINADPSAVTIFFTGTSSNGVATFLEANWILILIIVAVAAGIIGASMRRR